MKECDYNILCLPNFGCYKRNEREVWSSGIIVLEKKIIINVKIFWGLYETFNKNCR